MLRIAGCLSCAMALLALARMAIAQEGSGTGRFGDSTWVAPSYCVEPSHLHASFAGKRLAAFVRQLNKDAVLVLNPGGPVTAVLRMAELEAIASEA